MGLPYRISDCKIKLVKIKIPWTSLSTESIQVLVDGIYVTVSPLDASDYEKMSQDEINKEVHGLKEQILQGTHSLTTHSLT